MEKKITPFYVIIDDVNKREFTKYDVMPYLVDSYKETKSKDRPKTFTEFKTFVERKSRYMYWSRCEYEIILKAWVSRTTETKIDIHWQIMNNIDLISDLLMKNVIK